MAIPSFKDMMLPLLKELARRDLSAKEARSFVAEEFSLTDDERAETLKSGHVTYANRVGWALTHLHKAGLVEIPIRGNYVITDEGRSFLATDPRLIEWSDLERYPSFREWQELSHRKRASGSGTEVPAAADDTPEEAMRSADAELRDALADDLLHAVMAKDPYFFEHLVARLLEAMGYGESLEVASTVTPKSGDEGIDGIVKEDRLGFDSVYYQAKRYDFDRTVGRPDLQAFVGALSGKGASKGLFITTASFSKAARSYAEGLTSQRLVLVDGRALAGLMIDYGVGVSVKTTYRVCSVDSDFFEEE